jgi:hypothetical protein
MKLPCFVQHLNCARLGFFAICTLLLVFEARSQEPNTSPGFLDRSHKVVSRSVINTGDWFDAFFGDKRIEEEAQGPRLRLRPSVEIREKGEVKFRLGANVKMPLPNLEDRLQLVMEGLMQDDNDDPLTPESHIGDVTGDAEGDFDLSTAARVTIRQNKRELLNFDAGVRLRSDELRPFIRFRARKASERQRLAARFTQKVFWIDDDGWGETTQMDIDSKLKEDTLFRASTAVTWSETTRGVALCQSLSLFKHIDEANTAISLTGQVMGHTDPSEIENCVLLAKYRRLAFRKWFFVELEPGAEFPLHRDRTFTPYLKLKFDIIFGDHN